MSLLGSVRITAQSKSSEPPLLFKGKITYERKQNVHKQLDEFMKGNDGGNSWIEQVKKNSPKYKTDYFELIFNQEQSLYKPAKDGITESKMMMGNMPADRNIVYKHQTKSSYVAEKLIFEKPHLIKDSLRTYEWKITEEFRKIAGYNCRRAETIILDSVYVIAFYTDAIINPSGPEAFNGLPGMILGLVMPRLNVTYFATKVDNVLIPDTDFVIPTKGEKVKPSDLNAKLSESLKQWGNFVQRVMWWVYI